MIAVEPDMIDHEYLSDAQSKPSASTAHQRLTLHPTVRPAEKHWRRRSVFACVPTRRLVAMETAVSDDGTQQGRTAWAKVYVTLCL